MLSGSFSGLNLGVLGLDLNNLQLLQKGPFTSEEEEREAGYAKKIEPLRKRGNLLLCAILLGNVAVNSLLSILMAGMSSGLMGFISSTALIVVFGEIVP
jgi:metal transporter CNNM